MHRIIQPFYPIEGSSGPSFQTGGTNGSTTVALQSSAVNRTWAGPNRSVRVVSTGSNYYLNFGSSDVVAASTNSMEVLANTAEVFLARNQTHMAVFSTGTVVNVTLGYGQ